MKKILMTLAAVGLFFSCSKENAEPQLQPSTQQGQETALQAVDPSTPGAIRLTLDADVESFKVEDGGFAPEGGQSARATELVVGGPDINKAISYHITPDANGTVPVLMCLYDSRGQVFLHGEAGVTNNGKGLSVSLGLLLDPANHSNRTLKRMAQNKLRDVKLAFIVGHDKGQTHFTNKGPKLITYQAGKVQTLGDNYIMLKATNVPLKYDEAAKTITVDGGGKVSLGMQGYIIGARFRNNFPKQVYRYYWEESTEVPYAIGPDGQRTTAASRAGKIDRPPLDVVFRIDNLSATYQTEIGYDRRAGEFQIGVDLAKPGDFNYENLRKRKLTPGLVASAYTSDGLPGKGVTGGTYEYQSFLDVASIGTFYVPVGSAPNDKQFSNGEQFVITYCPNPHDTGSVAYRSPTKVYYDGSPLAQMTRYNNGGPIVFHALSNEKNAFIKVVDTPDPTGGNSQRRASRADNKFYFVTFPIESMPAPGGSASWIVDRKEAHKRYVDAFKRYGITGVKK